MFAIYAYEYICKAMIRQFSVVIVFTMIFEFFKVLEGIPALKRVADTLALAGSPLMSFSLVLGILVFLFAGAAMLAFGQKMEGFSNIFNAVMSTLIVMTTGDTVIYAEQYDVSPIIATIWYWLLVTIMYLVCMRLILCILMDAYGEASEDEEIDDTTLYEQGYDTITYLVRHHLHQVKLSTFKFFGYPISPPGNAGKSGNSGKLPPSQLVDENAVTDITQISQKSGDREDWF
jgi:hypothetical protein